MLDGGDIRDAVDVLEVQLAQTPAQVPVLLQLAKVLEIDGQYAEAEVRLRDHLENYGDEPRVVASLMNRMLKLWRPAEAIELGTRFFESNPLHQKLALLLVRAHIEHTGTQAASSCLGLIAERCRIESKDLLAATEILECDGDLDAWEHALRYLQSSASDDRYLTRETLRRLNRCKVLRTSRRIIESVDVGAYDGVAVILDFAAPLAQLWEVPLATEMRRRGWWTVILERKGCPWLPSSGNPAIDEMQGILDSHRVRLTHEPEGPLHLRREWIVDIEQERIEASGINIFQPVCARIGTKLRRHRFNWDHELARAIMDESIAQADVALSICEALDERIASKGVPVRLMSGMSHFAPATIYKRYCELHRGQSQMEYIGFVAGYEHYYTNLGNKLSTTLSVANLTQHPQFNTPKGVTRDQFIEWRDSCSDSESIQSEVEEILHMDRAQVTASPEIELARNRIMEHRKQGKPVVCLFGKIMYDVWMDIPGGPGHKDIIDWCNHTIETVRDSNVLLLIKPHPNEIKRHIARPNEFFTDLITSQLNENTLVLGHDWFNMSEIIQMIDLGLLWSGTSSLELMAGGVPAMVCSHWGLRDHPIQVLVPDSRDDYESSLLNSGKGMVDSTARRDAAMLIKYYSNEDVLIPHAFGVMPYRVGGSKHDVRWYEERVEQVIKEGDTHVARMADRVI